MVGTPKGARQIGQFKVPGPPRAQNQQPLPEFPLQDADDADNSVNVLDDALILDDEEGGTRIGDIYIPPPVPAHCSMESTGPRLIIKRIVNHNFKSYAGQVILGPFHHSFTAIIGPNGSGKSNVIDSMMFVFGCRANRIRCKKVSTLIHQSAKYPNLRSCAVAVHFEQVVDKDDGTCDTVPNSQFVVERTAMRDNTSYYQLNGKRVQLKEVAQLLKKHNVDLEHNRFLILQGEVESIAMMKPKGQNENESGMLEYLEDIVGTERYIRSLQQINHRVDQLTDERTDKHNRCKLAEREMKDLEQPYNEAVEFLRTENDFVRTKNWVTQKYISLKKQKLEEHTQDHEKHVADLKEHDEGTAAIKSERAEKEKIIKEEVEAYELLCKTRDDLKKKQAGEERSYNEIQSAMEDTNKQRKKDKAQIEKNEKELENLHKLPEKNEKEIEECQTKLERLEKEKTKLNEDLEQKLAEMKEKTEPLTEKRLKCSDELVGLKEEVNAAKAELQVHQSELNMLKQVETIERRKYACFVESYEESERGLEAKQAQLKELSQRMPDIKAEIEKKNAELDKYGKEERVLSAKCAKLREEINERSSNMQMQRSNNKVLDFLMRQKMEGKIPGILGRLGNLGGINAKYDIAISTACGRLDNIVVDRLDTAQAAIAALKQYNVGRASFIALEKLEHHAYPINTPENVPRLYDLVEIEDERVRPAFYFALGNTLVANDLEQGSRIAYGRVRFRVVTLRGEIIEQTGTMSGGGNRPICGKMGTQVQTKTSESANSSQISQKALEEMQIQAEELQSRINYCQEQQGRLERELQQLQVTLQRSESEQKHLSVSIKSLEQQMSSSLKQCEQQKRRMENITTNAGAIKAREAQITEAQKRLDKVSEKEMAMSDQIEKIQQEYDNLRNENVKPVEAKIKKVSNQIEKLAANIRSLNVALSTAERNIERINKNTNNLKENIKTAEDKLRELNEQRQKCLECKEFLETRFKEAEEGIKNAKSQSSEIKKDIDKLNEQEKERNLQRVEIETKVQEVVVKINEVKSEIPYWIAQLKPLTLHDIPGDTEPQPPLKTYTEEELCSENLKAMQYKQSILEEQLKKKPNLQVISEFCDKRDKYLERVQVLEDITSKRNEMRDKYEEVRKRRYTEFMEGFNIITRKLKEMYQMITLGGDAELELVDSMDPFTEGVAFSVRPPKKTWKNISNLSGGEKTLSSLALVFALHYYKPSPLYFMDEIDAALDFKNVSIVGHYIKERTKNAQFIIVSLRVNMFELSNYIVGIYKVNDCTQSITMRNYQVEQPQSQLPQTQLSVSQLPSYQFPLTQQLLSSQLPQSSAATSVFQNTLVQEDMLSSQTTFETETSSTTCGRELTFAPTLESTVVSHRITSSLLNVNDNIGSTQN
ncbi:structural maintenance of chromosomes protein 4 [Scaptodrosophila lebanonensis]|uniref:Structural maintenance of chromosomes protein n=1 Tax=Drosophila lebanonensis TaxID=7225 RepID=A0A6J2TUG4_DROLE|nr:structural maintenance of chromosomes protein 4 [Scaptodrosophila lebanonensis]